MQKSPKSDVVQICLHKVKPRSKHNTVTHAVELHHATKTTKTQLAFQQNETV